MWVLPFSQPDSVKLWPIPPVTVSWGTAWGCTWPYRVQPAGPGKMRVLHPSGSAPAIPPASQEPLGICSTMVFRLLYICWGIFYAGSITNKTSEACNTGFVLVCLVQSELPLLYTNTTSPTTRCERSNCKAKTNFSCSTFYRPPFFKYHKYHIFSSEYFCRCLIFFSFQ